MGAPDYSLILTFVNAGLQDLQRMLEGPLRAKLLDPQIERILRESAQRAEAQGRAAEANVLATRADLLMLCRECGAPAVFGAAAAFRNRGHPRDLPQDGSEALAELQRLQGASDPDSLDRQVVLCRMLLLAIGRHGSDAKLWGAIQGTLGNALLSLDEQTGQTTHLSEAVAAFQAALEVHDREKMPLEFAATQANLGNALLLQGIRFNENRHASFTGPLVLEGVKAFHAALEVYGGTEVGQRWAKTNWPQFTRSFQRCFGLGTTMMLEDPDYQKSTLEHMSGIGDDFVLARLSLPVPDKFRALAALGVTRAIMLNDALAAADGGSELREARVAWRAAQRGLAEAERREQLIRGGGENGTTTPADLASASTAVTEARASAHLNYVRYRKLVRNVGFHLIDPADVAELTSAIPQGGALVMPVIPSHGDGCALVLAAGQCDPHVIPLPGLDRDWLYGQLEDWFRGYSAFRSAVALKQGRLDDTAIQKWNRMMASVLTEIGRTLMAPIDKFLHDELGLAIPNAEAILMLPGMLSALPLHAAPVNAKGEIFADHWIVSQIANHRMLLAARTARERAPSTTDLLAITNPNGDLRIHANPAAKSEWFDREPMDLVGEKATISAVKSLLPHYTHGCFYCHAHWNWETPEKSGLQLRDGVLTLSDMRELTLNMSRFAMLSACETALLDVNKSPDEFISLPIALVEAGIPCVVGSLWPIPAVPTYAITEGVFRRHIAEGLTPAAALRLAQFERRGKGWRFPVASGVLGGGSPREGIAVTMANASDEPLMDESAPDLFTWAGFVCYGG
jgi:CHAT domain